MNSIKMMTTVACVSMTLIAYCKAPPPRGDNRGNAQHSHSTTPPHRSHNPPHKSHGTWGHGGENFWPGFIGGAVSGLISRPIIAPPPPSLPPPLPPSPVVVVNPPVVVMEPRV